MGVIGYTVSAYAMTAAISYLLMGIVVLADRLTKGAHQEKAGKEEA